MLTTVASALRALLVAVENAVSFDPLAATHALTDSWGAVVAGGVVVGGGTDAAVATGAVVLGGIVGEVVVGAVACPVVEVDALFDEHPAMAMLAATAIIPIRHGFVIQ